MNNWYVKNLLAGLKLALFMRCERRDFTVSWHALVTIALSFVLAHYAIDTALYGGGTYDFDFYSWYDYHTALAALFLLTSYAIGAGLSQTDKILNIAVMFYNAFFALFIPYCLLYAIYPAWLSESIDDSIERLILIWTFMVMFRIIYINFNCELKPQFFGALLAVLAVNILNSYVYIGNFYDTYSAPNETYVQTAFEKLNDEEVFAKQEEILAHSLSHINPSKKGVVDLYGISFASYGYQDVFLRESRYAAKRMDEVLKADNIITLINNKNTFFDIPMANSTNLRKTLANIAGKMQKNEDILLLYLTSHGSAETGLSVNIQNGHKMLNLSAPLLAEILKESGIKNKVIIISACYSGSMIDALKDENSLIITAAAKDKTSFGCSDSEEMTYFADAYFKQALSETTALDEGYYLAKKYVIEREARENVSPHSDPQIFIGENIRTILSTYKKVQLTGNAPSPQSE